MNRTMFKKIISQTNVKIDYYPFPKMLPNSIKLIKDKSFMAFYIDEKSNKTLIAETDNENKLYKKVIKYLGIKLDHHGKVKPNNR